jgi:UDP-glucose 4-epimerase
VPGRLEELDAAFWQRAGVSAFDVVFHLGAFAPKKAREADAIENIYTANLIGTRKLLQSLPAVPGKFIFGSSADVYAKPNDGDLLNEFSAVEPASIYAASKFFCEHLVRAFAREQGFQPVVLRYGHIYGPGEESYSKIIPNAIRRMVAGDPPVISGDGSAERDYFYVSDAVEATVRSVGCEPGAQLINIVSGTSHSVRDVVETLGNILAFETVPRYEPATAPQVVLRFDDTIARRALGSWTRVPFESGLRQEVDYFKKAVS